MTSLTGMKWADKIFPGFGLVWKEKRHILVWLDEKAGTGGFDDARITPQAALCRQPAVALAQVLQHPRLPLLLGGPLQRHAEGESGSQDADGLRKTESIHVELWLLLGRLHHPGAQGRVAQEQGPGFLHYAHDGLAEQDRGAQLMLLHLIIDQFELPSLMIARRNLLGRGRCRIAQGGGQARPLIGRHRLARARPRERCNGARGSAICSSRRYAMMRSVKGSGNGSPLERWICTS